ncbi:MAG: hypothetical protein MZU97_15615 [Bacillus subtilis]|nr:hypothetical protein [Bacillus subtilis]
MHPWNTSIDALIQPSRRRISKIKPDQVKTVLGLARRKATPFPSSRATARKSTGELGRRTDPRDREGIRVRQESFKSARTTSARLIDEKGHVDARNSRNEDRRCRQARRSRRHLPSVTRKRRRRRPPKRIAKGLEPLAKCDPRRSRRIGTARSAAATPYLNDDRVKTVEGSASKAPAYIIAETISDNANYRKWIREFTHGSRATWSTKKKKDAEDELQARTRTTTTYAEPLKADQARTASSRSTAPRTRRSSARTSKSTSKTSTSISNRKSSDRAPSPSTDSFKGAIARRATSA